MIEQLKQSNCNCKQCNYNLNPTQYELRQVYDPKLNPHMDCNHPGNYHKIKLNDENNNLLTIQFNIILIFFFTLPTIKFVKIQGCIRTHMVCI